MDPFIGEVQIFGFSFAPRSWAFANGQLIPINQNTALFSLYGITFGGNGTTNFALPNLVDRQACGTGQGPNLTQRNQGGTFGSAGVTLTTAQMPAHTHTLSAYNTADPTALAAAPTATAALGYAGSGTFDAFAPVGQGATTLAAGAISTSGSGNAHENRQPFLGLNYCVALSGIFPQRP